MKRLTLLGVFFYLIQVHVALTEDDTNNVFRSSSSCEIAAADHLHYGLLKPEAEAGSRVHGIKSNEQGVGDVVNSNFLRMEIIWCDIKDKLLFIPDTSLFTVDKFHYVVYNHSHKLAANTKFIDFSIYLRREDDGKAVSNPYSFTVIVAQEITAENEEKSYVPEAAIFAGVLILVIMAMALGIPLAVRAKRRFKQGKPLFKPGRHFSETTLDKTGNGLRSVESREPDWYVNTMFNYEEEVAKEKDQFTKDILSISRHQKPQSTERANISGNDRKSFSPSTQESSKL